MCATEAKIAVPEPAKAPSMPMNPPLTKAPVVKPAASAASGSSVPRPSAKAVVPGPPPAFPPAPLAMPPGPPVVLPPLPPPPPPPPSGVPDDLIVLAKKAYIDAVHKYTDLLQAIEASGQVVEFSGQSSGSRPPNSVPTVPVSAATPGPSPSAARADNPQNDPVM